MCAHVHTHARAYSMHSTHSTHTGTARAYIRTHTCNHSSAHAHMHAWTHVRMYAHMHACTHAHLTYMCIELMSLPGLFAHPPTGTFDGTFDGTSIENQSSGSKESIRLVQDLLQNPMRPASAHIMTRHSFSVLGADPSEC